MKTKSPITLRFIIAVQILIACLAWASSAFARIGETEAQIEKRYGKFIPPVMTASGLPLKFYKSAGFLVSVQFLNGVSAAENYSKLDKTDFSDHEIQLLLDANGAGNKWEKTKNERDVSYEHWTREGAIAARKRFDAAPTLMISTDLFQSVAKEARDREEAVKLKGF